MELVIWYITFVTIRCVSGKCLYMPFCVKCVKLMFLALDIFQYKWVDIGKLTFLVTFLNLFDLIFHCSILSRTILHFGSQIQLKSSNSHIENQFAKNLFSKNLRVRSRSHKIHEFVVISIDFYQDKGKIWESYTNWGR